MATGQPGWAEDAEQFAQAAVDRRGQGFYTRYGNPNHAQVAAVGTIPAWRPTRSTRWRTAR